MSSRSQILLLVCASLLAVLGAGPEPEAEDVQANRKRYAELQRSDPKKFAAVRNDGLAFLALPPDRQKQIVDLDQKLHQEHSTKQTRLVNTLDRYVEWFEQLPPEDQRRIRQASTKEERLSIIQDLRHAQWLKTQPKSLQDQADQLMGEERVKFIQKSRAQERQRQADWQLASRFWKELDEKIPLPARLDDFDHLYIPGLKKVKAEDLKIPTYVREYLMPMLSPEEKKQLAQAEGKWPEYPRTLVELADKHPPALRGAYGHKSPLELPKDVLNLLDQKKKISIKALPQTSFNKWPAFAVAFSNMCYQKELDLPNELWVFREAGLHKDMKDFIRFRLLKVINKEEETRLFQTSRWPDYPHYIQELADKYHLDPPWFTLPGPRSLWDRYRAKPSGPSYPELSAEKLREFLASALKDMDEEQRNRLKQDISNPEVRQYLTELYFERNPQDLNRLRQLELKKRLAKKNMQE